MHNIVLTGVDNSDSARRAAEAAAALADAFGAELHVISAFSVHMAETFQVQTRHSSMGQIDAYKQMSKQHRRDAEQISFKVANHLRNLFPDLDISSRAIHGAPGAALLNESRRITADLIVVGNKRVQGPARILGSIARTVAGEASCNLYIVNTHQR